MPLIFITSPSIIFGFGVSVQHGCGKTSAGDGAGDVSQETAGGGDFGG
jgi:hypothetical protein